MDEAGGSGGLGVSCRDYLAVYGVKEDIICVYSTEKMMIAVNTISCTLPTYSLY